MPRQCKDASCARSPCNRLARLIMLARHGHPHETRQDSVCLLLLLLSGRLGQHPAGQGQADDCRHPAAGARAEPLQHAVCKEAELWQELAASQSTGHWALIRRGAGTTAGRIVMIAVVENGSSLKVLSCTVMLARPATIRCLPSVRRLLQRTAWPGSSIQCLSPNSSVQVL